MDHDKNRLRYESDCRDNERGAISPFLLMMRRVGYPGKRELHVIWDGTDGAQAPIAWECITCSFTSCQT